MTKVFDQLSKDLHHSSGKDQNHWLASYRSKAWETFKAHGLPDRSWEDWRYLSLRSLKELNQPLTLGTGSNLNTKTLSPYRSLELEEDLAQWITSKLEEKGLLLAANLVNQVVIVCFKGTYHHLGISNSHSATEGLSIDSLTSVAPDIYADFERNLRDFRPEIDSDKNRRESPFYNLNSAFLTDGMFITAAKTADTQGHSIQMIHIVGDSGDHRDRGVSDQHTLDATPACAAHFPRLAIHIKSGAKVSVTETYIGLESNNPSPTLCIPVTQILLEPGAILDHVRIQQDTTLGFHIGSTQKTLRADSQLKSFSLSSQGSLFRHDLNISLTDKNADAQFDGLFLVKDSQMVDHHTTVDHRVPNTQSRQLYHGIVSDHGRGIFNGKVLVRLGAHGTDARQTNKNLILSSDAEIDTKPELQIDADDVKCSHGAAVGQMDPDHLFYLQARGIPEALARKMLLQAFAHDCLERFPVQDATLSTWVNHQVMEYFSS